MTDCAIVTGASNGIGAATAARMARAGWNVVVNYASDTEGAARTIATCEAEGRTAIAVRGDIADIAVCEQIAETARGLGGGLRALINNAGVTKFTDQSDLYALSAEDFERIFAVNVTGTFQMTRAARTMLAAGGGAVVNTSSIAGVAGIGSSIAYAASKGALNTMTLSLARMLAPEIRVNAVCPAYVDSNWWKRGKDAGDYEAVRDSSIAVSPLKTLVTPDHVAESIEWFALGSVPVTGQLLVVDAGLSLTIGRPEQT